MTIFGQTLSIESLFLIIAVMLVLSVVASKFSDRFGVPALLVFLLLGMLAGSEGIGGLYFDNPAIAQLISFFALAVILFSGGLDTEWDHVRPILKESLVLATLGVVATAAILGYFAYLLLDITPLEGFLIGAITSSTDAAAVFALLRSKGVHLQRKVGALLEFESGSNDPMAIFLTVGVIQLIQNPGMSPGSIALLFVQQLVVGGLLGLIFGKLLLFLINRIRLGYDGLYPVMVLGLILLTFSVTTFLKGSGFLAVYLLGLTLGKADFLHKKSLIRFYEGLAWLFQIVMFLTLGLFAFPSRLLPIAIPGMILSLILIFVARPVSVWLGLLPFKMPMRVKAFVSWVGLRGAVPVILATYPMVAGLDQSSTIFHIIFFVVVTSVLIQGTTIPFAARLFKVEDPNRFTGRYPLESNAIQNWHGKLQEAVVKPNSPLIGKAIYELKLPKDYLVVLVSRDDEFLIPNGSFVLQKNDRLLGLATSDIHEIVEDMVKHGAPPPQELSS